MNRILSPFPSNKLNSFDLRRLFELTRFPSKALNLASYFNSDYIEPRTKSGVLRSRRGDWRSLV